MLLGQRDSAWLTCRILTGRSLLLPSMCTSSLARSSGRAFLQVRDRPAQQVTSQVRGPAETTSPYEEGRNAYRVLHLQMPSNCDDNGLGKLENSARPAADTIISLADSLESHEAAGIGYACLVMPW
jgi:hypothetical protein